MAKGQLEFIAIIGIVIIAIVAIYYLFLAAPAFPVSPEVPEHLKHVQAWVLDIIKEKFSDNIAIIEAQGGFLQPAADSPIYNGRPVAYWSVCGNTTYPTLSQIETALREKTQSDVLSAINESMTIDSKQVSFDKRNAKAEIKIEEDKINFALWLPTKIAGEELEQPYVVTVPTRFGYIYKFGKDFADVQASKRLLEWATIRNMYYSKLPTFGWLTECGQMIMLTSEQTSRLLRDVIEYTLNNIGWWTSPVNTFGPSMYVSSLDGKKYSDIKPMLTLPLFYVIEGGTINIGPPEPIMRVPSPILSIIAPYCFEWYNIGYTFRYPAIVTVYDNLTKNNVNFAVHVGIEEMRPAGNCEAELTPTIYCENPTKPIDIIVLDDTTGQPISNAVVQYEGCIFRTYADGKVVANVSASHGTLTVSAYGYGVYSEEKNANELQGLTIRLKKPAKITFDFYDDVAQMCERANNPIETNEEAIILIFNASDGQEYAVSNFKMSDVNCTNLHNIQCIKKRGETIEIQKSVTVDYLPPGNYTVTAMVMSKKGMMSLDRTRTGCDMSSTPPICQEVSTTFWYENELYDMYEYRGFPVETAKTRVEIPGFEARIKVKVPDMDFVLDYADEEREIYGCMDDDLNIIPRQCLRGIGNALDFMTKCKDKKMAITLNASDRCTQQSAQSGILKLCQEELNHIGAWYKDSSGKECDPTEPMAYDCKLAVSETCLAYKDCFKFNITSKIFEIKEICKSSEQQEELCGGKVYMCPDWTVESWKCDYYQSYMIDGKCWCSNIPKECIGIRGCFNTNYISICDLELC